MHVHVPQGPHLHVHIPPTCPCPQPPDSPVMPDVPVVPGLTFFQNFPQRAFSGTAAELF